MLHGRRVFFERESDHVCNNVCDEKSSVCASVYYLFNFAQAAEWAQMLLVAATWTALHDRIYRAASGRVLTVDDFDKFNNNKK